MLNSIRCLVAVPVLVAAFIPPLHSATQLARATAGDVAWMAGTWSASDGARTVEEHWTPPAGGAMLAVSRTIAAGRLAEFEYLRIVERDGGLVYVAQPNGRPPTDFPMTTIAARSVTFENPQHDYPQTIRYEQRPDGALVATIAGAGGARAKSWTFTQRPADAR